MSLFGAVRTHGDQFFEGIEKPNGFKGASQSNIIGNCVVCRNLSARGSGDRC